ncbi:zinc finger, CCHC-type containing protein [Tanacetum coccineum]
MVITTTARWLMRVAVVATMATVRGVIHGYCSRGGEELTAVMMIDEMRRLQWYKEEPWRLLNIVSDNIGSAFMSTSKLKDSILWHARVGHVHFKRMQDISKDGLIPAFDIDTKKCKTCMLTKITKKLFQNVKHETKVLELIHDDLCDLQATPSLGNKK